jgi:hypothetical protein
MTTREIVEALDSRDLVVDEVFGGLDDEPFELGADRCIMVATRR